MKNILFISQTDKRVYLRQTKHNSGDWNSYHFDFEVNKPTYGWLVVHDDLPHGYS